MAIILAMQLSKIYILFKGVPRINTRVLILAPLLHWSTAASRHSGLAGTASLNLLAGKKTSIFINPFERDWIGVFL